MNGTHPQLKARLSIQRHFDWRQAYQEMKWHFVARQVCEALGWQLYLA